MNKSGQMIMVRFLLLVMTIMVAIACIPALNDVLDLAQQDNALNCEGFIDEDASATINHSYNSSKDTDELACLAIDLYLPYILLTVLIGGVTMLLAGGRQQDQYGGYGGM